VVYETDPYKEEFVYETEATFLFQKPEGSAVLVEIDGEEHWIPDSQIDEDSEIYHGCDLERGDVAIIIMTEWIAQEKGLI
jgi:hypothetical protein